MSRFRLRPSTLGRARVAVLILAAALTVSCFRSPKPRLVEWPFDPTYAALDRILSHGATPAGFRYEELAKDPSDLKILKLELAEVTPEAYDAFTRDERLAFLINAHNIYALDRIVANYPVHSIEDTELIGSALEARDIRLAGRRWSLLELRNEIAGPSFKDSRAVFMLNWGMRGCPPLPEVAPTAANLEALLERQTRAFIQNEDYNRFIQREKRFEASPLLETYRMEIERDYTTLHLFLARFSSDRTSRTLKAFPPRIYFNRFDTTLNDAVELPAVPKAAAAN